MVSEKHDQLRSSTRRPSTRAGSGPLLDTAQARSARAAGQGAIEVGSKHFRKVMEYRPCRGKGAIATKASATLPRNAGISRLRLSRPKKGGMRFSICCVTATAMWLLPAVAAAQGSGSNPPWSADLLAGVSANADRNSGHHPGADFAVTISRAIVQDWSVRIEAGTVSWPFDYYGSTQLPRSDTVTLRRLTVDAVRTVLMGQSGFAAFVRGGVGLYDFAARVGSAPVPRQLGANIGFGLLVPLGPSKAVVLDGDLDAVGGPGRGDLANTPVFSTVFFAARGSVGLRLRF